MHTEIKTFEDACKAVGTTPAEFEKAFEALPAKYKKPLESHAKLIVVAEALNEGWTPDWNDEDEYKYYPWFDMEKSKSNKSGFVLDSVRYYCTHSIVGSRLCFKSRELAQYAATQFEQLYKDYYTF